MQSFKNSPRFLGTIVLLALVGGCSFQLSQAILSKNSQKPLTSINLAAEPLQATLIKATPAKTCLNFTNNHSNNCPQLADSANAQRLDEYQQLVSQLGGASRQKLINSQLAWETFMEAQCDFETRGFDSITLSSSVRRHCLDTLTQQRTQNLKRYLTSNQ